MTELRRVAVPPRSSHAVSIGIGLTAVLATAVITKIAMTPAEPPAPTAPPPAPKPIIIPIPAPTVTVVQAPAPAPPPAPPPPPPPAPADPSPPRAATPQVHGACLLAEGDAPAWCNWDAGFPAISADGTTIATAFYPDDSARGYPGLSVLLLDARSAKVVREISVLDPNDYVPPEDPQWLALRAKVEKRTAVAQRVVDDGGYRSMIALGADTGRLRAEVADDVVRVIDTAANTSIWQRRFQVSREFPPPTNPDADTCNPNQVRSIAVYWDEPTRTFLTHVDYSAGPCYCPDTQLDYVQHLPVR